MQFLTFKYSNKAYIILQCTYLGTYVRLCLQAFMPHLPWPEVDVD